MVSDSSNLSCCYSELLFLSLEQLEWGNTSFICQNVFSFLKIEIERTNGNALDKSSHDHFIMSKQLNIFSLVMCRWTFSPASIRNIFIFESHWTNYHCTEQFTLKYPHLNLNHWPTLICAIIKNKLLLQILALLLTNMSHKIVNLRIK